MKQQKKIRENFVRDQAKQENKMAIKSVDNALVDEKDSPGNHKKFDAEKKKKKFKSKRKPRLIVRNLPYKAKENSVREHFAKFGEVTEVVLLRKPNKQLVGCGFVQFDRIQSAAKAIAHASGQPFLGRPIIVDWAVAKDKYVKKADVSETVENIKTEIKDEEDDSSGETSGGSKRRNVITETISDDDDDDSEEDEKVVKDENEEEDEDDEDDDDEEDDESDDSSSHRNIKKEKPTADWNREHQKPRIQSHDVTEGRTVFLRNLPFSVNNKELKEFGDQFGDVLYAVVCMDASSDHSRGTGFIKFKDVESVNQCILQSQNRELILGNRTIDASLALSREDATKAKGTEKVKKDNRNLYLLKEGLITAGSPAAEGVSTSDMEKRIMLEQWKTKNLRDLTKFVSRVRLVVYNLPPTYNDNQLRALFLKYGGHKPRLTEAKIMRNLRDVDANGVGRSKEQGFVTFSNHENALEALRHINNNPKIFGPNKRPIVSFSIEDKKMLNLRQRRQERSLMKNPTWKHYKKEDESGPKQKTKEWKNAGGKKAGGKTSNQKPEVGTKRKNSMTGAPEAKIAKGFMGAVGKPGEGHPIPLRKLRDQSELVRQKALLEKKKNRQNEKPERIKQPKQAKKKQKEGTDSFNTMVDKYKSFLTSAPTPRSKWYD